MVQISSLVLFSFLAAVLAAPAYKSSYDENDIDLSVNACFYFDRSCHSCPSSEFWDGQCHEFLGADIIMPGNGKHANGKGNHVKRHGHHGYLEREINQHENNGPHRIGHGHEDWNSGNGGNNGDWNNGGLSGDRNHSGNHVRYDGENNGNVKCSHEGLRAGLDFDQFLGLVGDIDALNPCHNLVNVNLQRVESKTSQ